jgi:excisionase family DNA binding protein
MKSHDKHQSAKLTITVEEAGRVLGLSRGSAYAAAARGEIPVLRFGKRMVVPFRRFMQMLGDEPGS